MGKQNLVIIDTGCANLASVRMAFERLGVQPRVSCKATDIEQADKLILPGVGTAIAGTALTRHLAQQLETNP